MQIARHQNRPHIIDYLKMLCDDFTALHGDRLMADDTTIIGEGGSGGAPGIGVVDRLLMMEYSYYTVASPEAAATIMWRDGKFAAQAAEAMQITAQQLKARGLIDDIIAEPPGGAHRHYQQATKLLNTALLRHLQALRQLAPEELLEQRYQKLRAIGPYDRLGNHEDRSISVK